MNWSTKYFLFRSNDTDQNNEKIQEIPKSLEVRELSAVQLYAFLDYIVEDEDTKNDFTDSQKVVKFWNIS